VISNDAVHYINIAKAIKEGILPSETILYSPGYPIFIMFINFLIKNYILSSKLVSLLSGILLLIPLYLLAKDVSDRKVAIIAVILASFNPMLVDYSLSSLTESVYTFLFVALLYVFFSSFKNMDHLPIS
jgi:4-amino-4-deoxy-L-arabinose transferase-like glycosyltransferase